MVHFDIKDFQLNTSIENNVYMDVKDVSNLKWYHKIAIKIINSTLNNEYSRIVADEFIGDDKFFLKSFI